MVLAGVRGGLGWFSTLLVFLLGGSGLPLGVPPLPEDPKLAAVAPEQCWFYLASAGTAEPDPKSPNQTEQLLAEPEVRRMIAEIEHALRASVRAGNRSNELLPTIASDDLVDLLKMLLTRPMAVYVTDVHTRSPLESEGLVGGRGGLIVHCGDYAAKLKTVLDQAAKAASPDVVEAVQVAGQPWRRLKINPAVPVVFGFHGPYFLVAVGNGEAEAMLKRLEGHRPAWLEDVRRQLPVERLSTVTYINFKAIKPVVWPKAASPTPIQTVFALLGFDSVSTLASVTGMDAEGCVSKTLVGIEGPPSGLLGLVETKPLAPSDLAVVPRDATFAVAFKLDLERLLDTVLKVVDEMHQTGRAELLGAIGQSEEYWRLRLREDLLASLGDTWRLFDSPSEGGVLAGTTLVVSLKDPQRAVAANAKLIAALRLRLLKDAVAGPTGGAAAPMSLAELDCAGRRIYTIESNSRWDMPPLAFSWCLTDKDLVVALYPQAIKAYLTRGKDFQSLAEVPEVAALVQGDGGPFKLVYCNTRRAFDMVYPLLPAVTAATARDLRHDGVELNTSLLPSARAVRPHLTPMVMAARRTAAGIEVVERRVLPIPGTAIIGLWLLGSSGVTTDKLLSPQQTRSIDNMKQIMLAIHNYHAARHEFPPAYSVDKSGKPLLSWRVLILPFMEGDTLGRQFHYNEPWDSEHNKKLLAQMPDIYKAPGSKVAGQWKTNYLAVRGKDTVLSGDKPNSFASIRDGSSSTIITVEVSDARAVEWTRPDDFQYDPNNPMQGLVGLRSGGFLAGLADGSVHFVRSSIDARTLRLLFTKSDGEPVPFPEE
jgi:hypothetical protein